MSSNPVISLVRVRGSFACFTRPENSTDRISYLFPPHSAARGVLEAVYWKPEMYYMVRAVEILQRPGQLRVLRNEVSSASDAGRTDSFVDRVQRMTLFMTDVDYLFHVDIGLTKSGTRTESHPGKHRSILHDRLTKGAFFRRPFLGMSECAAHVDLVRTRSEAPPPIQMDEDLGFMIYDRKNYFESRSTRYLFFRAEVRGGVLPYPSYSEVSSLNVGVGS